MENNNPEITDWQDVEEPVRSLASEPIVAKAPQAEITDWEDIKDWEDVPAPAPQAAAAAVPEQPGLLTRAATAINNFIGSPSQINDWEDQKANSTETAIQDSFKAENNSLAAFRKSYIDPAVKVVTDTASLGLRALDFGMTPFQLPQRATVGNIIRYLNPEMMNRMRKEQAENPWKTEVGKVIDEVAPPLYLGTDILLPKINKYFKDLDPREGDALEYAGNALGFGAAIAADVFTDPLFYTVLLAPSKLAAAAERAGATSKLVDGVKVVEMASPNGRPVWITGKGTVDFIDPALSKSAKAIEGAAGKDLLQVKLPFIDTPVLSVKGESLQKWAQAKQASFENSVVGRGLRSINVDTLDPVFNDARHINAYESSMPQLFVKDIEKDANFITAGKKVPEKVGEYAYMVSQVGAEGAEKVARFKGLKLSQEEIQMATDLGGSMEKWRAFGSDLHFQLSGNVIPPKAALTEAEKVSWLAQNHEMADILAKLPEEVRPFMFSENANLRRMRDPQWIANAEKLGVQLKDAERVVDRALTTRGLKETADAARERIPLSSWAYNYIQEKKTGVKGFFDPDVVKATQADFTDLVRSASDQKFANYVRDLGLTKEQWADKISNAKKAVAAGIDDPAIVKIAAMDPTKDVKAISIEAFKEYNFVGQTKAGDSLVSKTPLYYERSVADSINAKYAPLKPGMIGSFFGWMNQQVAKSYLTSLGRSIPQLYEATGASLMAGLTNPRHVAEAIAAKFKPDLASEIFHASGIGENLSHSYDVTSKIILKPKMYAEPGAFNAQTNINQMISNQTGTVIKEMEESVKKASLLGKAPEAVLGGMKKVVELANDNPLSRMTRDIVNGFENLPKEALFRQKLAEGYTSEQAIRYAGKTMLDFRIQSPTSLGSYVLFGGFHAQNLKRIPFMLAKNPWVANLTDQDRGTIRRAIQATYDWSPGQSEGLQRQNGPFPQEPVFGGFLPGADAVMKYPEHAQTGLNQLITSLLGKMPESSMLGQSLNKTPEGFQVLHYLPTTLGGARMFLGDFASIGANLTSNMMGYGPTDPGGQGSIENQELSIMPPAVRAAMIQLAGYDLVTGQKLSNVDEKNEALLRTLNPLRSPNFWNVFNGVMDSVTSAHMKSLNGFFNDPTYRAAMRIVGGKIDERSYDKAIPSQAILKSVVSNMSLGLFRLTQPDIQYRMHVMSMLKDMDELKKAVKKYSSMEDPVMQAKGQQYIQKLEKRAAEFERLEKFYTAYSNATQAIRNNKELSKVLLPEDNTSAFEPSVDNEETEEESENPELLDEETNSEEPQE